MKEIESFGAFTTQSETLTSRNSNSIDYGQYQQLLGNCQWWPYPDQWWPYPETRIVYQATEPTSCVGKAHVFECDHVKTCKCGKIKRSNPAQLEK